MRNFDTNKLKHLYKPRLAALGEESGQITIIGGSTLFHGAPLLALKTASRIVDMVFFTSPDLSIGKVSEQIKSKLFSFIWTPWKDVEAYIQKSDSVLIGPGLMRFSSERKSPISDTRNLKSKKPNLDKDGKLTRDTTKSLLTKHPHKRWVIDAGSLQTMDSKLIPQGAIITPNLSEFCLLFDFKKDELTNMSLENKVDLVVKMAMDVKCVIVLKGRETIISHENEVVIVRGGNPGMTKGGTGDCLAGLTAALFAKNDPFLAACTASYVAKKAADELFEKVGVYYNADDLANKIPEVLQRLTN